MLTLNLFYFLSFVAILSALMVVFAKSPVHSVLYLIVTLFTLSGHYILLNAQFLAAVHVIVYAGAIMVLFLYVIMLLNLNEETEMHKSTLMKLASVICIGIFMIVLVGSLRGTEQLIDQSTTSPDLGLVKNLGRVLFNEFLLPFEISSVLLLVAMVGAVMLGKSEKEKSK